VKRWTKKAIVETQRQFPCASVGDRGDGLRVSTGFFGRALIGTKFAVVAVSLDQETVMIAWTEQYSVGVRKLDQQHQDLFNILNELTAFEDIAEASELVPDILERVTKYANDHFKTEERIMHEYGYPEHASQVSEHTEFKVKIARFCMDAIAGKPGLLGELREYLTDWLTRHDSHADAKFKDFLMANGFLTYGLRPAD
jgi:hemerythrin-like metal-binding protein